MHKGWRESQQLCLAEMKLSPDYMFLAIMMKTIRFRGPLYETNKIHGLRESTDKEDRPMLSDQALMREIYTKGVGYFDLATWPI